MGDYLKIQELLRDGAVWSITALEGREAGKKWFWREEPEHISEKEEGVESFRPQLKPEELPGVRKIDGCQCFCERICGEPELVICGGGHISLELSRLADYMEYGYTVLDDRPEFCSRERFPGAKRRLVGDMAACLLREEFSSNASYIIVTRGHEADLECLEQVLGKPYGYVGMIGSRAKVARTMDTLAKKGIPDSVLSQVHAPIGLKIGGQTPREIAVSIVAELIQQKNQGLPFCHFDTAVSRFLASGKAGIILTIIKKAGSAPRGVGSRMAAAPDEQGINPVGIGTIGGGLMEAAALADAWKFFQDETAERVCVRSYQVNHSAAAALGMWCGGSVEILMEKVGRR